MKLSLNRLNILIIAFYIVSALFILKTIQISQTLLHLDKAVGSFHAPIFYFLQFYFYFLFLPIIFSIAAVIFFYCGLKVKDRSPLGWLLGLLFCLALPLPLWYIGKILIEPTTLITFGSPWKDYTILSAAVLFILLIWNNKIFNTEGQPIKKKYKLLLLLFFILVCLPTIILLLYVQYRIKTRDYDYPKVQSSVDFHIYRPKYFPEDRNYETNFFFIKKGVIPNKITVEVDVNYPLSKIMQTKKSGLILIKQSKNDSSFNPEKFIEEKTESKINIKKIDLPQDKIQSFFANGKSRKIIIIPTNKNTLIYIDAFYISEDEILRFAKSFY